MVVASRLCVRVVSSSRAGLGKTLFVHRLTKQLPDISNNRTVLSHASDTSLHVTVPLHGNSTDSYMIVDSLLPNEVNGSVPLSRVFHLDVSPSVRHKSHFRNTMRIGQFRHYGLFLCFHS